MSKKLECEIVQDLLPMYVDNLTSEYTSNQVRQHLEYCQACQQTYQLMNDDEEERIEYKKDSKKLKRYLKKVKWVHILMGAIIAFITYGGIQYTYYQLAYEVNTIVKSDLVVVTELYELENGWLFLRLGTTDFKRNNGFLTNISSNELDLSITRQVLPKKVEGSETFDSTTAAYIIDPESGLFVNYNKGKHLITAPELSVLEYVKTYWQRVTFNQQQEKLNAIYYQGENDRILIWERGMELPKLVE